MRIPCSSQKRSRRERAAKWLARRKLQGWCRLRKRRGVSRSETRPWHRARYRNVRGDVDFTFGGQQRRKLVDQIFAHHPALALPLFPPRIGKIDEEAMHAGGREQPRQIHGHVGEHAVDLVEAWRAQTWFASPTSSRRISTPT